MYACPALHGSLRTVPAIFVAALVINSLPFVAGAATARPPKLSELFGDDVLARGRGVEVRRSQLDEAFVAHKAKLAAIGQPLSEAQRGLLETQLLRQLIFTQMLTNRVTEADRKVAEELVEKRLKEAKEQAVSEEAFYRQLKAAGITPERYHQDLAGSALAQAVIQRELTATIDITDAQVREFYSVGTDPLVREMQADLEKLVKNPASSPQQVAQLKERIDEVRKANLAR